MFNINFLLGEVCFEPLDSGVCQENGPSRNLTRYFFNSRTNKCEQFVFKGSQGNHNNFHTENMCNIVCPGKFKHYTEYKIMSLRQLNDS